MHKYVLYCVLLCVYTITLSALEPSEKIEIIAKSLHTTKETVEVTEGVTVYYAGAMIKAKYASYNKMTKLLILDGNVEMIGPEGSKEYTDHMEIHTDTKDVKFKKLFLSNDNDIWLLSNKANKINENYILKESILSSCEVKNPLWYLAFSNSLYDSKNKYMKIYNARMYFWDIPVFYTPYLAFSTSKERSSGLLFPALSYSKNEGYLIDQPVFWAISPSVDMELSPQIRTSRSLGLYGTLRFVDSNHSHGKIRMGYFKDNESYVEEYKLKEDKHYGFEFNYESSLVSKSLLSKGYEDGLYINTTFLNDIDYINLQKNNLGHFGLRSLQESRANYFVYDNNYYMGMNAKYFIDTKKENNDDTVQILPSGQWHKYLTHLIWDNITYSVDAHINNLYRKKGANLRQLEFKAPFEFTTSFFDDYINLSISEELYYSKNFFSNEVFLNDTYQYYSNTHEVKIFTDLIKKYTDVIHVLQPSIEYLQPGKENETPVGFVDLNKSQQSLVTVGLPETQYRISLKQYIYNKQLKLQFFQRLSQIYYPDRESKLQDLNNEMQYNWKKWSLYNHVLYSHEFKDIRAMTSMLSLKEKKFHFSLEHSYKQLLEQDKEKTTTANSVNLRLAYSINNNVDVQGALNYDIEKSASTQWRLGGIYHQDCWSIGGFIRQDITPRPTGVTKENSFGFQLNFIPFGGIDSSILDNLVDDE